MSLSELARQRLLKAKISLEIDEYDRKLLSKCPTAVWVCNRVWAGLDEWILLSLLAEQYEKGEVMHPHPMQLGRTIRPYLIRPNRDNLQDRLLRVRFAKKIARRVKKGISVGLVIDFSDNPIQGLGRNWLRPQILRQLRKAGQPVVPIHLIADHPVLNPVMRGTLSQLPYSPGVSKVRVCVRVGRPIMPEEIASFSHNRLWSNYLRGRIFSLGTSFEIKPEHVTPAADMSMAPLAEPVDPAVVEQEIEQLDASHQLTSRGQFDVLVAGFNDIPNTMFEIARLREETFRAVGEGSGKNRDMDEYDLYYLQLIIWDREKKRIVGGYRLGQGDLIFKRFGVNGFYTGSLFKMRPGLYDVLKQSVELGRSYVAIEYQRHRLPLFLLWKGILHFIKANPQYRYLYGPVSISKHYTELSKSVIIKFVEHFYFDHELARHVRPRKPFRFHHREIDADLLAGQMKGQFDVLENFVEDIEPWHLPVPVLLRQYLRQNARFIAFNVDPLFSDCLDGLMLLDINNLPHETIEMLNQEK